MWINFEGQFQKSLAALPLKTYRAGEMVLANGSRTNELLILRNGNVAVVKEGVEIAKVAEPGAVFGEISALLDCPHTADVRALTSSQFHVAHPAALQDPAALFYVAAILATASGQDQSGPRRVNKSGSDRRAAQRDRKNN
jgi:CRP/FNR family cyclic AMP-dependent transcriptional regulator